MKKLFIHIMLFLCLFFLAGCGNKNNPAEEVEKNEYGVEATDDKTKVVDYLMAIIDGNGGKITDNSNFADISCDIDLSQFGEEGIGIQASCSVELAFGESETAIITSYIYDVYKLLEGSAKITFSGKLKQGTEELVINESYLNIYLDYGKVYCKVNVDGNILNMIGKDYSEINNNVIMFDLETLISLLGLGDISEYMSLIPTDDSLSIYELFDNNKEELKKTLEQVVENYNIAIKEVKGNRVTFVMDLTETILEGQSNSSFKIEYVVDVKGIKLESMLVNSSIDTDEAKGSFKINVKASENGTIEKISTSDKEKAIDFVSMVFPEGNIPYIVANTNQMVSYAYRQIKTLKTYFNPALEKEPNFIVPSGGYDGSSVTITFYHTMGSNLNDLLNVYINEFNKIYPNITIDSKQIGGYDDVRNKISTELQVGGLPNIAYCYSDHVALYNKYGAVVHLDDLISSNESDGKGGKIGLTSSEGDSFIEAFFNEGRQFGDGLMYTLPFSKQTELMYYNETFFAANNIPVPDHWFSINEHDTTSMEAVCKRIKEIDPNSIPLGYDSESNWFITMCEQIGSGYYDASGNLLYNNAYTKGFLKTFNEWYQKEYVTTQSLYGAYTSSLFTNTDPYRTKCYMSISSAASANHLRPHMENNKYPFEVGITKIPQMYLGNQNTLVQGPSVCIFKKDNPQEVIASWLFVKYLTTSVDFQSEFSMASGYMPVIKNATDNPIFSNYLALADGGDYISARAIEISLMLMYSDSYFTTPEFISSSDIKMEFTNLMTGALSYQNSNGLIDYINRFMEGIPFRNLLVDGVVDNVFTNPSIPYDKIIGYELFKETDVNKEVVVETFIQAKTKWYEKDGVGYASFYTMNKNCGYYIYEMECTLEQYDNLEIGEYIIVKGTKKTWNGLVEIVNAKFYEVNNSNSYIATPKSRLWTSDFNYYASEYANQLVALQPILVLPFDEEGNGFGYGWNNSGKRGDDIYIKVKAGDMEYIFVVESQLCDENSEVYKKAETIKAGDVIYFEGFLNWYNGPQLHIIKIN